MDKFAPLFTYIEKHIALSNEDRETISRHVRYSKFVKGQFIVEQGDVCSYESFVVSGCVRTYHTDTEGNEHVVMFAVENWWTADMGSFIAQSPADYNVQCLERTELIQIEFAELEKLYKLIPKLERFFRIIIQKAFVATQKRIVDNFSMPAKERYEKFIKHYPDIEQRVPQYMIASYLGITKEFLSKIRGQLP